MVQPRCWQRIETMHYVAEMDYCSCLSIEYIASVVNDFNEFTEIDNNRLLLLLNPILEKGLKSRSAGIQRKPQAQPRSSRKTSPQSPTSEQTAGHHDSKQLTTTTTNLPLLSLPATLSGRLVLLRLLQLLFLCSSFDTRRPPACHLHLFLPDIILVDRPAALPTHNLKNGDFASQPLIHWPSTERRPPLQV